MLSKIIEIILRWTWNWLIVWSWLFFLLDQRFCLLWLRDDQLGFRSWCSDEVLFFHFHLGGFLCLAQRRSYSRRECSRILGWHNYALACWLDFQARLLVVVLDAHSALQTLDTLMHWNGHLLWRKSGPVFLYSDWLLVLYLFWQRNVLFLLLIDHG